MSKLLNDDFGTLAICAIRYCHGRQTYMPAEEIAQRFETTVDSILTTLEEMVEKIREEVNQVWDKMEV